MIIDKDGYQMTRRFLKAYRRALAHVPIQGLIEVGVQFYLRLVNVLSKLTFQNTYDLASNKYISFFFKTRDII